MEWNRLCKFGEGHDGKYPHELILNLSQLFRRRYVFNIVLEYYVENSNGHFVWRSEIVYAILVGAIIRKIMI